MSEWKECTIDSIGKIITGKTPRTAIEGNYGGEIPFLTPSDDLSVKHVDNTKRYLTQQGLEEVKNCLIPANSICVSCIGSDLGKVVMTQENTVTNQQINSIIPNKDYDSDFVYYLMILVGEELNSLGKTSTAVPIVNKKTFSEWKISVPTLPTQQRIASILSSLDAKIENNNKINAKLEEIAQNLFKEWFVDFGPFKNGKFVESELGLIPEGWRVVSLGDIIDTTSGGTPSRKSEKFYTNGTINWVKSKELNGSYILTTEEQITEEAISKSSAKILPRNSVLIAMYGATVGEFGIISKEMTCNQAICALLPNNKVPYTYLFMLAKNEKQELTNMAVGSAQQNISQVLIKGLKIAFNEETCLRYHSIVEPIFKKKKVNDDESQRLATLRDTLLPKLMSGEIEV